VKLLVVHSTYRRRGGEEAVVEREIKLLRDAGVEVATLVAPSRQFESLSAATRGSMAFRFADHNYGRSLIRDAIRRESPDVMHAHNLFPLFGVGALKEATALGVRTVHTWHNYRASCLAGTHLYGDRQCTDCSIRSRRMGCIRGCYRGSILQSVLYASAMRVLVDAVKSGVPDKVVCLTEFQRDWFVNQGIASSCLALKPNSVDDGDVLPYTVRSGALYVGRLSTEKGVEGLVRAWKDVDQPLTVIGDGPCASSLSAIGSDMPNVQLMGEKTGAECRNAMSRARVVVVPSLCFEGLPMVVVEALAAGTPVVTFTGGSLALIPSVIAVSRDDYPAIVAQVLKICSMDPDDWTVLSENSVAAHRSLFSDASNSAQLVGLYHSLLGD